MGLGPSKSKIRDLLLRASSQGSGTQSLDSNFLRCNHRISTVASLPISTNYNGNPIDDQNTSLDVSVSSAIGDSTSIAQEVDDITSEDNKADNNYPNNVIGTIRAIFKHGEKRGTCFLIESNVVATAFTNVYDVELGGRAKDVYTTFSPDKIKGDTIHFVNNYEKKKKTECLAVIVYNTNVLDEWLGVEIMSPEVLKERDLYLVASLGEEDEKVANNEAPPAMQGKDIYSDDPNRGEADKKELYKKSNLHQISVNIQTILNKVDETDKGKICFGAPVFYRECNNNSYVVGFLSADKTIETINQENMRVLIEGVIKGKESKKKDEKKIEEDKIEKLDLSRNDFGPLDIKFLSEFNLKNLIDLDLSSNSIKPQGVFYFTQGKYPNLKTLNLNFNEIGDEGLFHLSNAVLNDLEQLFLFHNNISKAGVEALCKADFAQNLVVLSLSENQNIMDEGVQCFEKQKNWRRLMILNLNRTGLTDKAVRYLIGSIMPNLKKIHLKGNNFSKEIEHEINAWKLNGVMIDKDDTNVHKKRRKKKLPNPTAEPH